ncbi:MAG: hypothetical protein DRG31_04900 [Deltaproteobacteria bacterium]|nr:MAG: hypothetical protein DRG31_04900 [Deltaproteobacteria bacterium]
MKVEREILVALAGNPNSGKTTIFNNLTGARQHVGNWPGVTVEKKEGTLRWGGYLLRVVDLPGTYSLSAHSIDELIARNFVVEERPDVVVDIVDASNLERNLYLALQFMELEARLVIALNMMDVAESRGFRIDVQGLEKFLGVPVVPTVATKKIGMEELIRAIIAVASGDEKIGVQINYGEEIEAELRKIEDLIRKEPSLSKYPSRWLALKLLEGDQEVWKLFEGGEG